MELLALKYIQAHLSIDIIECLEYMSKEEIRKDLTEVYNMLAMIIKDKEGKA